MVKNGAEILIDALVEQGVDTIFGYPGGAVLNIYDALYKNSDRIRHILTAHEQGAGTRSGRLRSCDRQGGRLPGNKRTGCDQPRNRYCYRVYGFHSDGCHHRQRWYQPHRP